MTQEQFNKVCEIIREIDSLESAKKKIRKEEIEPFLRKYEISLLRRHEELIRQEIDNRINKLKKQIEEI